MGLSFEIGHLLYYFNNFISFDFFLSVSNLSNFIVRSLSRYDQNSLSRNHCVKRPHNVLLCFLTLIYLCPSLSYFSKKRETNPIFHSTHFCPQKIAQIALCTSIIFPNFGPLTNPFLQFLSQRFFSNAGFEKVFLCFFYFVIAKLLTLI